MLQIYFEDCATIGGPKWGLRVYKMRGGTIGGYAHKGYIHLDIYVNWPSWHNYGIWIERSKHFKFKNVDH